MSLPSQKERNDCLQWLFDACGQWLIQTGKLGKKWELTQIIQSQDINWNVLGKMAYFHSLEPLLHYLVKNENLSRTGIPSSLIKDWEDAYYSNFIQNTELLALLSQFLEESSKNKISIIVLKGPAAIALVYKDIGLRAMADLDILCKKGNLRALRNIAFSLGCQRKVEIRIHHLEFLHKELGVPLEVHFNLYHFLKNKSIFLNMIWKKQKRLRIEDVWIPVMSIENELIFEFAHIVDHRYNVALKHYLDFASTIITYRKEINWENLSFLLHLLDLKEEFYCLSDALSDLLKIPLEIMFKVELSQDKLNLFKNNLINLLISIGFIKFPHVGAALARQPGSLKKITFIFKRLFPPLQVLQAAYDLSSLKKAVFFIPYHILKTLMDFKQRKKWETDDLSFFV